MAGMEKRIMKLNKIIGMTAALLVGAGMTSVVMADNDRGHRGGKRGEHAKRGQAGPPQQVIEMWKNRREAAQRGGCGLQVRGGFKGFGGTRGPQARVDQKGPHGPKR